MQSVRDILETHLAAGYPPGLASDAEIDGISLILLDADVAGLAESFLAAGGHLRPDQWFILRQCVAHTRAVLPELKDEAWVYFARLHALAQALLRSAPDAAASQRSTDTR
jgi:hypothetical protein